MVDTQTAVTGPSGPRMPPRLFTTWMTSMTDGRDHAVTDEEFAAHRPEVTAVCDWVFLLAPLTCPNQACCPRCVAIVRANRIGVDQGAYADRRSRAQGAAVGAIHPIQWFRALIHRERSHRRQKGLSWPLPGSPVPAQRDRSEPLAGTYTPVVTARSIPTPDTDAMRAAPVSGVAPSSIASDFDSGDRLAVPSSRAATARPAPGRDSHQPLIDASSLATRSREVDQSCPVEAVTPRAGCLHQDHEMSGAHRAKECPSTAATTGAASPDAVPVVVDGVAGAVFPGTAPANAITPAPADPR